MHFGGLEFCVHSLSLLRVIIKKLILGQKSKEIAAEALRCEYNSEIAFKGVDLYSVK